MTEFGPEFPHARNISLVERHHLTPRKILLAGALALSAALPSPARAENNESISVPATAVQECPEILPDSPIVAAPLCSPVPIPMTCKTPDALNQFTGHFEFQPSSVRRAWRIVRQETGADNDIQTVQPYASIGISADRDTIYKDTGVPEATQLAGRALLGAEWQRFVIYPYRFRDAQFRAEGYDPAINRAVACKYKVMATLAMNKNEREQKKPWKPADARHYYRDVATYYKGRVISYVPENEPNYYTWLIPMKGKTKAETAAILQDVADTEIRKVDPSAEVGLADLSGAQKPLTFLKNMAQWFKEHHKIMRVDFVGYHPYQWFKKVNNLLPTLNNKEVTANSEVVAIDGMRVVKRVVHRLYEQGLLVTPQGNEPPIAITEFGAASRGMGKWKKRVIPDAYRARWYAKVFDKVCTGLPWIKRCIFYGFNNAIPPKDSNWAFDTSLANKWGKLDISLLTLRQLVLTRKRSLDEPSQTVVPNPTDLLAP